MLVALLRSIAGARAADEDSLITVGIVVGHGREQVEAAVRSALNERAEMARLRIRFLHQTEQRGTGHAVRTAMESPWGVAEVAGRRPILVLPGDSPLISSDLIQGFATPLEKGAVMRVLTCEVSEPRGYGRVVRVGGRIRKIVEERDANTKERAIREVAVSMYHFDSSFLAKALPRLTSANAQGEFYLTDVVGIATRAKKKITTLKWPNSEDVRGVNDLWELALAEREFQRRIVERHARNGVRFLDPNSVAIESTVTIGEGVKIHRGVVLRGDTALGDGVDVGSNTVLRSVRVGDGVQLKAGCYCEDSEIESGAKLGPYAHLRPGSVVGKNAKIGNFVELKKSRIGADTSIAHLSYLGDAIVGERVNIGCGFITCNFDGRTKNGSRKHQTIIEDDCFVGSDCQTIAPVRLGQGAYVASGSTITRDVDPDALAIARARQENKLGYAKRFRDRAKDK